MVYCFGCNKPIKKGDEYCIDLSGNYENEEDRPVYHEECYEGEAPMLHHQYMFGKPQDITVVNVDSMSGGTIEANVTINEVKAGQKITGVKIGSIG